MSIPSLSPVQQFWGHLSSVLAYGSVVVSLGLLIAGAVVFAQTFHTLVSVLALSLLLTYLLYLPVNVTEKALETVARRVGFSWTHWMSRLPFLQPRFVAVVVIYGTFGLGLLLVLTRLLPVLVHQATDFIAHLPAYWQDAQAQLRAWFPQLPAVSNWVSDSHSAANLVSGPISRLSVATPSAALPRGLDAQWLGALGGYVVGVVDETFHQVFYWVALVMMSFYTLLDGHKILAATLAWLPGGWQTTTRQLAQEFHHVMLSFVKGQVLLGLVTGCYMGLIYSLFGIKYALLLALWFALAELMPVVGTWVGLTPGLIVAFATTDALTTGYIWLCSYIYQSIKDNILQPKIAGDLMGLHPLAVMLALLLGAQLAGLLGVVMALPIASMLNRLLPYLINWVEQPLILEPITGTGVTKGEPTAAHE
jgi:predicted PurR-regulated permease PerM